MQIAIQIVGFICVFGWLLFALSLLWTNFRSAPFVPSSARRLKEVIQELNLTPGRLVDIGCGDGRIVFTAARLGWEAHGVEGNLFLVAWCKFRSLFWRRNRPTFSFQDLYKADYSTYDLVYLYLFPEVVNKLALTKSFKPGATIISLTFPIDSWEPVRKIEKYFVYKAK